MSSIIMNFSNVYIGQDFIHDDNSIYMDMSDITGTDCYCDDDAAAEIKGRIGNMPVKAVHYIDSGNYHYVSSIWLDKITEPFTLVVFDNHPDMQPPAFGDILSCGGWIKNVLDNNGYLEKVLIIGVNRKLTDELEDELKMYTGSGKAAFITRQEIADMLDCSADGCEELYTDMYADAADKYVGEGHKVYISLDKDVLDERIVSTNWDQGDMRLNEVSSYINAILKNNELAGMDVCGEPSLGQAHDDAVIRSNEVNRYFSNIMKNFLL